MFQQILSEIPGVAVFPIVGLVIFLIVFTGIITWALKADKRYVSKMAHLPLDSANNGEEHHG